MPDSGLSEHARMLVLERLRPGDVIVTTAQDSDSRRIQRLAGGYSHAAIFAGFGVIEATYDEHFAGSRFTFPRADDLYMGSVDGAPVTLWAIPDVSSCDVYRFNPQTADEARKYSRLADRIWNPDLLYQPYASPRALAQAWLEFAWLRRRWVGPILNNRALRPLIALLIGRRLPRHLREGYFCSQLVALVYAKAGLDIFKSLRPMPGDLARALSRATPDPVVDSKAIKNIGPSVLRGTAAGLEPRLLDLARSVQDS